MIHTVRRQGGFTLLELMIVVAVIGILATVVIAGFGKTTRKASALTEVQAVFAELRIREEQYQLENGRFISTSETNDESETHPTSANKSGTDAYPVPDTWTSLKLNPPESKLKCAYVAIAGAGGDDSNLGDKAKDLGMTEVPATNWFYLLARCDMDGDTSVDAYYLTRSDDTKLVRENEGR
jgi:prepilin-type N-terminal cleavage/methylation domain-containing protein